MRPGPVCFFFPLMSYSECSSMNKREICLGCNLWNARDFIGRNKRIKVIIERQNDLSSRQKFVNQFDVDESNNVLILRSLGGLCPFEINVDDGGNLSVECSRYEKMILIRPNYDKQMWWAVFFSADFSWIYTGAPHKCAFDFDNHHRLLSIAHRIVKSPHKIISISAIMIRTCMQLTRATCCHATLIINMPL